MAKYTGGVDCHDGDKECGKHHACPSPLSPVVLDSFASPHALPLWPNSGGLGRARRVPRVLRSGGFPRPPRPDYDWREEQPGRARGPAERHVGHQAHGPDWHDGWRLFHPQLVLHWYALRCT